MNLSYHLIEEYLIFAVSVSSLTHYPIDIETQ